MEFIFKFFDVEIALVVFDMIRCYPFLKFARRARREVQLCPHTGTQTSLFALQVGWDWGRELVLKSGSTHMRAAKSAPLAIPN